LASAATGIYDVDPQSAREYLDDEAIAILKDEGSPLRFEGLRITESVEESKALNDDRTPKVIISSSGMCDAGRIRHHLKHNLWRNECAVVFTGFQAQGTLGRILVDGVQKRVSIYGEQISIQCGIYSFRNLSAHADRAGLLKWLGAFEPRPERVFVVHGEESKCLEFTQGLREMGYRADAPKYTAVYDVALGEFTNEGREPLPRRADGDEAGITRESPSFVRLSNGGKRLLEVIERNRGGANRDLTRFADQIIALAEKWDR
jgi:metallo-beta-lactamase family protein